LLLSDGFDNKIIRMNINMKMSKSMRSQRKIFVIGLRILVE